MTEQQKPKPEFDNDADLLEQFNGEYTELFDYLADKYGFDIREDILKGEFDPDEYLDGGKFDLDEYVDEESHQFDLATESDLSEMKHVLESFPGPIKTIIAHAIDNGSRPRFRSNTSSRSSIGAVPSMTTKRRRRSKSDSNSGKMAKFSISRSSTTVPASLPSPASRLPCWQLAR